MTGHGSHPERSERQGVPQDEDDWGALLQFAQYCGTTLNDLLAEGRRANGDIRD